MRVGVLQPRISKTPISRQQMYSRATDQATRVWLHMHVCMHAPHTARCMDYWACVSNRTVEARAPQVAQSSNERQTAVAMAARARASREAASATALHETDDAVKRQLFSEATAQAGWRTSASSGRAPLRLLLCRKQPRLAGVPPPPQAAHHCASCGAENSPGWLAISSTVLRPRPGVPAAVPKQLMLAACLPRRPQAAPCCTFCSAGHRPDHQHANSL